MTDSLPKSEGSLPIGYELSPRARAYFDARPEKRDPKYTCTEAELVALLERHGLPVSQAILDFERNFGGWCYPGELSQTGFGLFYALHEGDAESNVARLFRQTNYLFDWKEGAFIDEDDADHIAPIHGTGYPRVFHRDRPLAPVGMSGEELIYFIDRGGTIHRYITLTNEFTAEGDQGQSWLERWALTAEMASLSSTTYQLRVLADVGQLLADEFQLNRAHEACDRLFEIWTGPGIRLQTTRESAPNVLETELVSRRATDLVSAVRRLRRDAPKAPLLHAYNRIAPEDRAMTIHGHVYPLDR